MRLLRSTCVATLLALAAVATSGRGLAADPLPLVAGDSQIILTSAITADKNDDLPAVVDEAIGVTSRRFLTANVHTPWQILHGILALRKDFQIKMDGEKTSALKWLSEGNEWKDESIVVKTPWGGEFHRFTKPYHFEGHPNQFLAILTMSELATDYEFLTSKGESVTIEQMLNNAKMTVNDREEITWTLWTLSRYLPIDTEWINKDKEPWSMERLVQIQTYADVNHAACGGTHGLFALSLARNSYIYTGKPLRGIWLEADQKIKRYITEARTLQNDDGTFSTSYFAGPGNSKDFGKRIATSGHILEFLMVAADDKELQKPWLRKAVRVVATDLIENRRKAADCGPLYHALHALVLYQQRIGHVTVAEEPDANGEVEESAKQGPMPENEEVDPESKPTQPATTEPSAKDEVATSVEDETEESTKEPSQENKAEVIRPLFDGLPTLENTGLETTESSAVETTSAAIDDALSEEIFASESETDSESEQPPEPQMDMVLEENALSSIGMSGSQPEANDVPLPPTSD